MSIPVKLEVFEGPLDLLLHLIDKNKVDIYDIPIVEITEQYLDYVKLMKEENLDIVSEFLVMASTLILIKAKMLLPPEVDESGEELDPREDLVKQLLEYKMYKYMSYELRNRQKYAGKSVYKIPTLPEEISSYKQPIDYDSLLKDIDIQSLTRVFEEIAKKFTQRVDTKNAGFGTIELEGTSIDEKIEFITEYARKNARFSFRSIIKKARNKAELIISFLSILELMKTGEIHVTQNNTFDDIIIISEIAG